MESSTAAEAGATGFVSRIFWPSPEIPAPGRAADSRDHGNGGTSALPPPGWMVGWNVRNFITLVAFVVPSRDASLAQVEAVLGAFRAVPPSRAPCGGVLPPTQRSPALH